MGSFCGRIGVLVSVLLLGVVGVHAQSCSTVSNTTTCTAANGLVSVGGASAESSPYPLSLTVPALSGSIQQVTVKVNNLTSTSGYSGGDFMIVLVSPNNEKLELLSQICYDDTDISNISLTFDDTAANRVAGGTGNTSCSNVVSGTFKPTATSYFSSNVDTVPGVSLTSANVAGPKGTGTLANSFTQTPQGIWHLYVAMVSGGYDTGTLGNASTPAWSLAITMNAANVTTSTSISGTGSPSFANNSVTFTAHVTPTPTGGTVQFLNNGASINGCGSQAVASGVATCTASLTEGPHNITAAYSGTTGFGSSTSPALFQVVNNQSTSSGSGASMRFCNSGSITENTGGNGSTPAPATPYASEIFVSGMPGNIENLTIDLNNFSSSSPRDTGLLLVGPNGKTLDFFSWVGGASNMSARTFTISDNGANGLLQSGTTPTASGVYQPTSLINGNGTRYCTQSGVSSNTCNGVLVSEAPPDTFVSATTNGTGTLLGQFGGASPNGTWQLFVVNRASATGAQVGGWCLNITDNTGDPTITTLTSDNNPSFTAAPGAVVNLTATVVDAFFSSQISTGTVSFTDNGTTISGCSAAAVSANGGGGGQATCQVAAFAEGSHHIIATYSGTASLGTSNAPLTQVSNTHTTTSVNGNTYSFCNPGGISIPAGQPGNTLRGPAAPFPSNILISNLPGTVNSMTVNFGSFTFSHPDQLQSLLVGPAGTTAQSIDFLSQLGSINPFGPIAFTMSDAGSSLSGDPANSGTYKPYSGNANNLYSSPAPAGPYQYAAPAGSKTFANVFGSGSGNTFNGAGTWQLYLESTVNGAYGSVGSWCVNLNQNLPDLSLTGSMTHSPTTFKRGQTGSFSVTPINNGPGPSSGTITITDTLPTGLTFTSGTGANWSCSAAGQVVTCTNSTVLAANQDAALTINFTVGNTTADTIANVANLSGGSDSSGADNSAASGNIAVLGTNLTVNKTHTDPFTPGTTGVYTITVHNSGASGANSGPGVTGGTITVTDSLPNVFTPTAFAGTGWTCSSLPALSCTLNAPLAVNSDATISLTVNVAANASGSVTNTAILNAATDQVGVDPVHHDDATNIVGAPVITSPTDNSSTSSTSVTVLGTGISGASISILDSGTSVATGSVDNTGHFSVLVSLAIGAHTLTATQTFNGFTSAASNTVHLTVAPPAPSISAPTDGTVTTNPSVTVSGGANPNAAIQIFDGANLVGSGNAAADGAFSIPLSLAIGSHALTAKQVVNSITSAASNTVNVTIAPPAPAISSPATGTVTTNTSVTVTGTSLANASITIFDGANLVATFTADGAGNWTGPIVLTVGAHTLTAKQTVNSITSGPSNSVSVTVSPNAPSITSPSDGATVTGTSVPVSGTAAANASITILDGGNQVGTANADSLGAWNGPITLSIGTHVLTAKQTVNGVLSAASNTVNLTVAPLPPAISSPTSGFTGTNTSITVSGTATANASISIFNNSNPVGSTAADGSGNFSVAVALAVGQESLTAKQTVNSITSAASAAVTGVISPLAPSITSPATGFTTTSSPVTVSGTATANASISISDGASQVATTSADGSGNFSLPVSLAIGVHSLTAKQTVNSVASAASNTVAVTIAPVPPAITTPATGYNSASSSVTVGGTASPNAAVAIFDGINLAASINADGAGNFSTSITLILGGHTLTAKQTINGVTSAASNSVSVTINSKITPTITWSNPADIAFGSALSSVQLNATASVPGTFVYTPPAGTVLPAGNGQTLSVQFTPTDTTNYNNASASVQINVTASSGPANLVVTRTLSRDTNNDVLVTLKVANTGGTTAANVQLTSAKIGSTATVTPLPQPLGDIPGGGTASITVRFAAASVGAPGTSTTFTYAGSFTGNLFSGTSRIALP